MSSDANAARYDELNLARLNLISGQEDVGDQTTWSESFEDGPRMIDVRCVAGPGLVIPHGADNDVNAAIIDLFVEQDMPESGIISVSAAELLRRSNMHRNGQNWIRLHESLDRLYYTNYTVTSGWRDHTRGRWMNEEFRILASRAFTSRGRSGQFDERTILRLVLSEPIVHSMRGGYVKPLDMAFMRGLKRPRARLLFRALDAMRYDPEHPEISIDEFRVNIQKWADHLKIPSGRADTIRRALDPLHQELVRRGYLREVLLEGRGLAQNVTYVFARDFVPINPHALEALRRHHVAEGVARNLVLTYGPSAVIARVATFERQVASGTLVVKKSEAAALVHLVKNPDQYGTLAPSAVTPASPPARRTRAPLDTPGDAPERSAQERIDEQLAGLDAGRRGDHVAKQLALLYGRKFNAAELDEVRHRVVTGTLDARDVLAQAYGMLARMEGDVFVNDLRALLRT
ncbi:replication initiator protein A [Deinococcus pimensis]|uniref:replication initiator protein A n=1 Tax=Deinococcus pimensis TaxID=309888 RepID=UPI0004860BFA|nr:replication initiator protein A [Deinococcus pimensis]